MTALPEALGRLADAIGIARGFHRIDGVWVPATVEGLRAICRAMGHPAESEADAARALATIAEAARTRLAPETLLLPAEAPTTPIHLAAAAEWRLETEAGAVAEGRTDAAGILVLPVDPGEGYHTLHLAAGDGRRQAVALIAAPPRGFTVAEAVPEGRCWGLSTQCYALRDARDAGVGDLSALGDVAAAAAARGCGTIGINPLHALFPDAPDIASPYFPASRLWRNVLMIDPAAIPERPVPAADGPPAPLVDWPRVARARMAALDAAYAAFETAAQQERRDAFAAFRAHHGEGLRRFAIFMALRESMAESGTVPPLAAWPQGLRDAEAPEVEAFAAERAHRVRFQEWLQFEADRQLGAAAEAGRGLRLGLYADLAVGTGPDAADVWTDPQAHAEGMAIGSPPDPFSPEGQNWGLVPLRPDRMAERGYARFAALLQAGMRHAGALRIDHAMGLTRQYWIPEGQQTGAYIRYPLEDLLRVAALESRRQRCVLVGEDLGTVPEGFRERMAARGLLSYRIQQFERWPSGLFRRPAEYPAAALAAFGTHDLPTIAGFWEGTDIAIRAEAGGWDAARIAESRAAREEERALLVAALVDAGCWQGPAPRQATPALTAAIHAFLAATPSAIVMVQMEDAANWRLQVNLPGTIEGYPNWRRRFTEPLQTIINNPIISDISSTFAGKAGGRAYSSGDTDMEGLP